MDNYSAVVKVISKLHPLEGLDRLQGTNIFGNQILVGKDVKVGDIGLYFPVESQLGEEYCIVNDLIRRRDESGKMAGGMFDSNRRVRAQKFRGHQSAGFWIPLDSLEPLCENGLCDLDSLQDGDEFNEFNGYPLSTKYIIKRNISGEGKPKKGQKPRESRVVDGQFSFHFDTAQLAKNLNKINPNDQIVVTWKLHGTSAIASRVLCKQKATWRHKVMSAVCWLMGAKYVQDYKYDYLYASRKVVKNEFIEAKNHYYSHDIWSDVGKTHFSDELHKGETVYYEIIGHTNDGGFIQKDFDYNIINKGMGYGVYVYRITQTNADGVVFELQWNQLKERCAQMGVEHVPEIYYGYAYNLLEDDVDKRDFSESFFNQLKRNYVYDQNSQFCTNKVPEEGICVRKEGSNIEIFKLKSFRFLEKESKALDTGEIDIESNEAQNEESMDSN